MVTLHVDQNIVYMFARLGLSAVQCSWTQCSPFTHVCTIYRQKTIDEKTWCPCANGVNGRRGTGRGIWCGNCLWLRMGQNINEVRLVAFQWMPSQSMQYIDNMAVSSVRDFMTITISALNYSHVCQRHRVVLIIRPSFKGNVLTGFCLMCILAC